MFRVLMNRSLILAFLSLFVATAVLSADQKGKNAPKSPAQAKVEGVITAVGASSVTITRRSGASTTVGVNATTKVERNDRRATLAAFKVGDQGEALFNATTLVASKVEATGP